MAATTSTQLPTGSETGSAEQGLNVLIVGGGIGGFTAAIALRQQGHRVTIFESAPVANETGAAIHLAPNANGILRRLGIFAETFGANDCLGVTEYDASGPLRYSINTGAMAAMWQHPWQLVHRVHLHQALRDYALRTDGPGTPAKLHLGRRVASVDPATATVTFKDGSTRQGDVVLGADGVGSKSRAAVPGGDVKPFDSGKSAFRFLIEKEKALADPDLKEYIDKDGFLTMWIGVDRRLVMYPCSNDTLLNFVALFPSVESDPTNDDWNTGGNKNTLLKIYQNFHPDVHKILSLVDPATLKVWTLLDMAVLPAWTEERLALLGDAAHPFLPHQGQGGGQAIEDAASIAVLLPADTKPEEIANRLKLYEKCRKERADRIQEYTRLAGRDAKELAIEGRKLDMMEYTGYNFGHDEWDSSTRALEKHFLQQKSDRYLRSPVCFGPFPGPRQNVKGEAWPATQSTFSKISVKFRTSRTLLDSLLAPGFSFASPATVASASWSCSTIDNMEWLGKSGYSHLGLYLHGVCYTKKDGSKIHGTYVVVLFENMAEPITSGREELGMPKLPCDIHVEREASSAVVRASWRGAEFLTLSLDGLKEAAAAPATNGNSVNGASHAGPPRGPPGGGPPGGGPPGGGPPGGGPPRGPPPPPDSGLLFHRYVPAVGRPGKSDADYAVFVPHSETKPDTKEELQTSTAKVAWNMHDEASLPTLHHVTSKLAQMPFLGVVEAKIETGTGVSDLRGAMRIE